MDKLYNLNDLALISGFTTRTLRSDITAGTLDGEKVDGVWQFTAEQIDAYLEKPGIRRRATARQNALVYDFLADTHKSANGLCVVLDLPVAGEEVEEVQKFFCAEMCKAHQAQFYARWIHGLLRVTLSGAEEEIARMLSDYYGWKAAAK